MVTSGEGKGDGVAGELAIGQVFSVRRADGTWSPAEIVEKRREEEAMEACPTYPKYLHRYHPNIRVLFGYPQVALSKQFTKVPTPCCYSCHLGARGALHPAAAAVGHEARGGVYPPPPLQLPCLASLSRLRKAWALAAQER